MAGQHARAVGRRRSVRACYHPARWAQSLNVDRSDVAVSLEALLDVAPSAVCGLVWEALTRPEGEPLRVLSKTNPTWRGRSDDELRYLDEHDREGR